jgi:hypothetical protein
VLLRNIVARLHIKDAARTAVLASRWRRVWHSTPLVLSDAHLHPKGRGWPPTPPDSPAITAAVSSILAAHAGPLTLVHLTCSHMNKYQAQLARWLRLLAAKDVRELVLVNRPWPLDVPLPAEIFRVTTLTRLYIGLWKFPDVASLPSRTTFPHLRELGICSVVLEDADIDVLVAKSPVLEILNIYGSKKGATPSPRQQDPPVRANLRLYFGEHRCGESSMPRSAHPGGISEQEHGRWFVHQDNDS